jgi:uncharacterized protein (TIGR04141 family)
MRGCDPLGRDPLGRGADLSHRQRRSLQNTFRCAVGTDVVGPLVLEGETNQADTQPDRHIEQLGPAIDSPQRLQLNVYLLKSSLDGQVVVDPGQYIEVPDDAQVVGPTVLSPASTSLDFTARLWVEDSTSNTPGWLTLLQQGFADIPFLHDTAANKALLIVGIGNGDATRYFAIPFGTGRHLMRRDAFEPSFGRRLALNLIFPQDAPDTPERFSRLRQVEARTVDATVFHTRRQASRHSEIATFGMDYDRDFLLAVVGIPEDQATWGPLVTGGDPFRHTRLISFAELGLACRQMLDAYNKTDYQAHFAWVDRVRTVRDPQLIEHIEAAILQLVEDGARGLYLAPPDPIDFEELDGFAVIRNATEAAITEADLVSEIHLADYFNFLNTTGRDLSIRGMRSRDRLYAVSTPPRQVHDSWPVFKCLCGEMEVDGKSIVISDGNYFEVNADYLQELDAIVEAAYAEASLPAVTSHQDEGRYNETVAAQNVQYLLMDRRNIVLPGRNPIEACDLLTLDRNFIHIKKRGKGSESLSHLFTQGAVSADLLRRSKPFAARFSQKVAEQDQEQNRQGSFVALFPDGQDIVPANCHVTFAIIADWTKFASPLKGIPFFSRVHLRYRLQQLRDLGYSASWQRIQQPIDA